MGKQINKTTLHYKARLYKNRVAKKKKKNVARTPLKSAVHLHSGKSKESFPIRVSEGAPKQGSPTFNL